jgi:hypothetical protein
MTRFTEEDFDAWRENAITRAVFSHLQDMKSQGERLWTDKLKSEIDPDPRRIHVEQIELKAKLEFIEDMLGIELGDIQEDEQQGTQVTPIRGAKRR